MGQHVVKKMFEYRQEIQGLRQELEICQGELKWWESTAKTSLFVGIALGVLLGLILSIVWRVIFG